MAIKRRRQERLADEPSLGWGCGDEEKVTNKATKLPVPVTKEDADCVVRLYFHVLVRWRTWIFLTATVGLPQLGVR